MGVTPTIRALPDIPAAQRAAAEESTERTEAAVRTHGAAFVALSRILIGPTAPGLSRARRCRRKP